MKKFWYVKGPGEPSFRHSTEEDAVREAERLAFNNPGVNFFVLEATLAVRRSEIHRERLEDPEPSEDGEPPF